MAITIKQSNFQTQQNIKIDIDKVYSDFIQKIDSIRSYVNVSSVTKDFYTALKSKGSSGKGSKITAQQTKQESRCHAFYRLLGLPIVSADHKFYNPGYDIVKNPGLPRTITLETKINIATRQDPDFELISLFRELLPLQNLDIFSKNTSIDAATRSVSLLSFSEGSEVTEGVINFRPFAAALDDGIDDPFKTKFKNYKLGHTFNVGTYFVKFADLRDVNNVQASQVSSAHIIKPFIVDPRIDFTAESKVCVPFANLKAFTKVESNTYAQAPILELIINERFADAESAISQGTFAADLKTFIEQNDFIKDEELVTNFAGDNNGLQQKKLLEFLKISQAMISQLAESIKPIQEAQGQYYWLPVPSTIGPEGNCSVRKNIVSNDVPSTLFTKADEAIIILLSKSVKEQLSSEAAKVDGRTHNGNFVLGDNPIFNPAATRGVVETASTNLQKLLKTRNDILSKANTALRTIEIIMGEFSGLGLADIIALIYSFYLLEDSDLLGFLDDDAYDRFASLRAGFNVAAKSDISKSMTELNKTVKSLYEIMDKMYLNSFNTHSSKT